MMGKVVHVLHTWENSCMLRYGLITWTHCETFETPGVYQRYTDGKKVIHVLHT